MKKETSRRRRRFRILFRRRYRRFFGKSWFGRGVKALFRRCVAALRAFGGHVGRLLGKIWRGFKAWFGRRVAASLRAFEYYGARFFKKIWSGFRSFPLTVSVCLLVAVGVLGGSFVPGLLCWFGGLWNLKVPDGVYYLRSPLITAGAGLLAAFVAACFFHLAQLDCR